MITYDPDRMKLGALLPDDQGRRLLERSTRVRYVSELIEFTARRLLEVDRMTVPLAQGIRYCLDHYGFDLTPASPSRWCEYEQMSSYEVHSWHLDTRAEETLLMRCYRLNISQWAPRGRVHNSRCQFFYEQASLPLIRRDQLGDSVDCVPCGGAHRDST